MNVVKTPIKLALVKCIRIVINKAIGPKLEEFITDHDEFHIVPI